MHIPTKKLSDEQFLDIGQFFEIYDKADLCVCPFNMFKMTKVVCHPESISISLTSEGSGKCHL